jgi:hypothetical protein
MQEIIQKDCVSNQFEVFGRLSQCTCHFICGMVHAQTVLRAFRFDNVITVTSIQICPPRFFIMLECYQL